MVTGEAPNYSFNRTRIECKCNEAVNIEDIMVGL